MPGKNILKPRKKPIQARSKATVHTIYEAALELFTQYGYSPITTDKIAERAGVSIGTLYQYFPNKESILVGMWEQIFDAVVIGNTTHSLTKPGFIQTDTDRISACDHSTNTQHDSHTDITGVYTGSLTGNVDGSVFNIQHPFTMKSCWTFDVGETFLKLDIDEIPVIGSITGSGTIDLQTGCSEMIFTVPVLGKMPGTGRIDSNKKILFHIPRVNFSFSARLSDDGSVEGSWDFEFSFIIVNMTAKGRMSGALLTIEKA